VVLDATYKAHQQLTTGLYEMDRQHFMDFEQPSGDMNLGWQGSTFQRKDGARPLGRHGCCNLLGRCKAKFLDNIPEVRSRCTLPIKRQLELVGRKDLARKQEQTERHA
jgi:hypothetical protein